MLAITHIREKKPKHHKRIFCNSKLDVKSSLVINSGCNWYNQYQIIDLTILLFTVLNVDGNKTVVEVS